RVPGGVTGSTPDFGSGCPGSTPGRGTMGTTIAPFAPRSGRLGLRQLAPDCLRRGHSVGTAVRYLGAAWLKKGWLMSDEIKVSAREVALAVVLASLTVVEFLRDWSYHLMQDMESLPSPIKTADPAVQVSFINGMRFCFYLSGIGAMTVPLLGTYYLWNKRG